MKHILKLLFLFPIYVLLDACSNPDILESREECIEKINGFNVRWRSQITESQKKIVTDILNNMVYIEGQTFVMGATPEQKGYARNNEYPLIHVRLSDYYICKYEVSDEQYRGLVSWASQSSSYQFVTWKEWKDFISVLKDMTGLPFSLPTEAQWEYAARGGKLSKNYIYPGSNNLDEVNSFTYNSGSTHANELGIFNMADLKSEWCLDYYEEYPTSQTIYYDRLIKTGESHVVRGGSYNCSGHSSKYLNTRMSDMYGYFKDDSSSALDRIIDKRYCRVTARSYYYESEYGNRNIGCRLVINSKQN
ncbi:Formylglycine-generating enzyme, required for sulfatase activity, contains SUMF1/FGE domain [Prevotella communis]|uniref:Formylglycine-generating enzyme, required for sulfatase activity, contains SUMF1/FGE domain n=1 Tax=Prevotella communis TaxID=2913614 RepID=A0A1G7X8Y1_9BACT|nr:SUMF1/EgtB/PvdO family nonheme iron enzyme [Prevotella communis]SDG80648.1 Formylglycine-generating enzyme, required for sulfatase activity, contains SUMF1/FGE domain [Prevotella communis]